MPDFEQSLISDAFLDAKRQKGDPKADALMQTLLLEEGIDKVRETFDLLITRIEMPLHELPQPVQEFVQDFHLPDWLDESQVRISEQLFRKHGPRYLLILYFKALPTLYACANGAKVLSTTGRLAHQGDELDIFARRIAETGEFLVTVLQPDGLLHKNAIDRILKVRLIHAAIRAFVQEKNWDAHTLGVPVNQEDLAITLQTFSSTIIEGLLDTGIDLNETEETAIMHHWNVIGHCLGVDEDLRPQTFRGGLWLKDQILDRQARFSEDGKKLTEALIKFGQPYLPQKLNNAPQLTMDYFVDDRIASSIGLKSQLPWYIQFLPLFLLKLFNITARLIDFDPNLPKLMVHLSQAIVRGMVGFFNEYKQAPFAIPDDLTREWLEEGTG